MLNRALDLVKIGVSGLVFKGHFQSAVRHLTTPGEDRDVRFRPRPTGEGSCIATNLEISPVILERTATVATITLNRPENGNRIDAEMASGIREVCRLIAEDDRLQLVVLTATGKRLLFR